MGCLWLLPRFKYLGAFDVSGCGFAFVGPKEAPAKGEGQLGALVVDCA
jgi:hypothetical protein